MTISYYEKTGPETKNIDDEIPFDIPSTWCWCRGFSCFKGMNSAKPEGEFFDYVDIDAIDNKQHKITTPKRILVKDAPSRASRAVENGSVLFSLVRPYLENIAYISDEYEHCIASTGFYVCNSNGSLYPQYMYYLMLSDHVIQGLNEYMKGDNSPSISKEHIENWLYPIPPLQEQYSICKAIEQISKQMSFVDAAVN